MDRRALFQAAAVAALLAFVAVILQVIAATSIPAGVQIQPGSAPLPRDEFMRASREHPGSALGFFGADSLFILSYLLVFAGLYAVTAGRARPFALIGLGAGILTALLDASENTFLIVYAQEARNGLPLSDPALPLIYILTNLKWMASFATLAAFGAAFPRGTWLERLLVAAMLAYTLMGVLGIANDSLLLARGVFFLVGMPLFAWYFWRQASIPLPRTPTEEVKADSDNL